MSVSVTGPELKSLRQAIDGVDTALADLLACRVALSRQAQVAKAQVGVPIVDPTREDEVRQRYERMAPGAGSVAEEILKWCRNEN